MRKMKHGQAQGSQTTPEYSAWHHMKQRCENPNDDRYKDYGGRGIRICNRWQDFSNFFADMGKKPKPEYSIDCIDNDGNYESNNCKWSTPKEQANNRRPISCGPCKQRFFFGEGPHGEIVVWNNQTEFAREFGLKRGGISNCLRRIRKTHHGWKFQWVSEQKDENDMICPRCNAPLVIEDGCSRCLLCGYSCRN